MVAAEDDVVEGVGDLAHCQQAAAAAAGRRTIVNAVCGAVRVWRRCRGK